MKQAHLLLVEDNEGDILLTQEAFEDRKLINKLSVVRDGKEALNFVFKKGEYKDVTTPDLILLDINLPKVNGLEVLEKLKNNEKTKSIPIIILTTSSTENDIFNSYQNHANSFITKPVDMDSFLDAVHTIEDFWFQLVSLSKHN